MLDQGDVENVLAHDKTLQSLVSQELKTLKMDEERVEVPESVKDAEKPKPSGQLVVEEEVAVGHLGWSARVYSFARGLKICTEAHVIHSEIVPRKHGCLVFRFPLLGELSSPHFGI